MSLYTSACGERGNLLGLADAAATNEPSGGEERQIPPLREDNQSSVREEYTPSARSTRSNDIVRKKPADGDESDNESLTSRVEVVASTATALHGLLSDARPEDTQKMTKNRSTQRELEE